MVLSRYTRPPEARREGGRGQASWNQSADGVIVCFAESSIEKSAASAVEGTAVVEVSSEDVLDVVSRAVVSEYMAYVSTIFLPRRDDDDDGGVKVQVCSL